jgi:hypothetical protein
MGSFQDRFLDSEINPHAALLASESYESPSDREWARWVRRAEKKLGHSLDGNQATDGYSLDYAHDYFANMDTVEDYVADVRAAKAELDAAFGPVLTETAATTSKPLHPFCNACGWRKGGLDSWDGHRCKCGLYEPPIKMVCSP